MRIVRLALCWALVCWTSVDLGRNVAAMDGWRDHGLFYYAPRLFLKGADAYDWDAMKAEWYRDGKPIGIDPGTTMSGLVTPPSMAILTLTPALAPPRYGYRAMDLWSLTAVAVCILVLINMPGQHWPAELRLLFAAFLLSMPDVTAVLLLGQTTLLVCACLCLSLYACARSNTQGSPGLAGGVGIGLALAKFTLSAPFIAILAYRHQWRSFAGAVLVFAAATLVMAAPGGIVRTITEFRTVVRRESQPGTSYDALSTNQTYMPDRLVNGERLLFLILGNRRTLVEALNVGLAIGSLAIMAIVLRPGRRPARVIEAPLEIALLTLSGLLLFYHRDYDLAVLMLVVYALIEEGLRGREYRTVPWILMCLMTAVMTRTGAALHAVEWALPRGTDMQRLLCRTNCSLVAGSFLLCAWILHRRRSIADTESTGA